MLGNDRIDAQQLLEAKGKITLVLRIKLLIPTSIKTAEMIKFYLKTLLKNMDFGQLLALRTYMRNSPKS